LVGLPKLNQFSHLNIPHAPSLFPDRLAQPHEAEIVQLHQYRRTQIQFNIHGARPVSAYRAQQRHDHLIDRRRNAVQTPLSHNDPISGVVFQRPACHPVCQDGIDSIRRLRPEPVQYLLTDACLQLSAFSPSAGSVTFSALTTISPSDVFTTSCSSGRRVHKVIRCRPVFASSAAVTPPTAPTPMIAMCAIQPKIHDYAIHSAAVSTSA
jgi:hypothetical protein